MKRVLCVLALVAAGCAGTPTVAPPGSSAVPTTTEARATTTAGATTTTPTSEAAAAPATPAGAATLVAAGDIASCGSSGDEATARVVESVIAEHPDTVVATLGDNVYEAGTPGEFARCYEPSWGRFKDRTRPAVGNHDYGTPGAAGYLSYFGLGSPTWYSYDLGAWHVVVLDSNCSIEGCRAGGAQEQWLRADLAAHPSRCTLAYWHHPRFSSGTTHGSDSAVAPLFNALAEAGADVVLNGHEHNYERFAPVNGVREFVVGTGGASHYPFGTPVAGSEVRNNSAFGVLRLTLRPEGYDWKFLPAGGATFTDEGSAGCQ